MPRPIAGVRASVFKSEVIVSLVEILKNDDPGVRGTAAELFKMLAQFEDRASCPGFLLLQLNVS